MWYHISSEYLGRKKVLTPKICGHVYEEGDIPRICVSDSLFNCLCAIIGNCKPDTNSFLRQFSENPCVYFTEEKAYSPPNATDFRKTNEHWFLKPTCFIFLGKINLYHFLRFNEIVPVKEDIDKFMIPRNIKKYYTSENVKEHFLENLIKSRRNNSKEME